MSYKFLTTPSKSLYQSILSTSTSFKMSDIKGFDGEDLTSSDFGTVGYGVFLSSDKQLMELFSFDPTTIASTSINFIDRGLPFDGGAVSVTANKLDWASGSTQVLIGTDSPQVLQYLKDYIDAAVINAGVPATDVVPGISIEATTAEIDADTEERTYGGLQYKLFINPAKLILSKFGLRLPTADQKAALAGSQGVPNATNTYITKDNVYDAETDQTQATQNSTVEFGEANTTGKKNIITQSFTPTKTKIKGVKLYKSANTGTFTGDVTVALFADSAGSPTGSALATVTITNAVYNALSVGEFEAIFSAEYSMTAGTLYWFKVSASTADNSNHPNLGVNTAGGYASGSVKYYNGTDGYVAIANIDLYFKTLQGENNQISGNFKMPVIKSYSGSSNAYGDRTSRFDITNPSGTTFRYTYDGTGTDPTITSITFPIGAIVNIDSNSFSGNNRGSFLITGSGTNYFEITNASGVAENDKVLGTSSLYGKLTVNTIQTWTKPSGLKYIKAKVQGAGMGGNGYRSSATTYSGAGGNSGAYCEKIIYNYNLPPSINFSVGKGGLIGAGESFGFKGGASNFFTLFANGGGKGSEYGASYIFQNHISTSSGGDINIVGNYGNGGQYASDSNAAVGGKGFIGGNGGNGNNSVLAGTDGQDGLVIIEEYY